MFEIMPHQRIAILEFFSKRTPESTTVFFDKDRISFATTTKLADGIRDEELTIYANGKTKIEKSESIGASENTIKPFKKDDFY